MSAALDARGLKRVCNECGGRFYDFNKRPIICPSCGTEFTGEIADKSPRGRVAEAAKTPAKAEPETKTVEANDDDADVVSLEAVAEGEDDIDDEDLAGLGEDLSDLDAGIDMDDDEDDLDADLSDVAKNSGSDE